MRTVDRTGIRYGLLVAVEPAEIRKGRLFWRCRCDCGNVVVKELSTDVSVRKSCGCNSGGVKHGHDRKNHRSPEYHSWASMRTRCTNPRIFEAGNYSGRGITFCERWKDFTAFLADMGPRPSGTSLDRYPDNNGNYEPGNCRWATRSEQRANTRKPSISRSIVSEIKAWLSDGFKADELAVKYSISRSSVYTIRRSLYANASC